MNMQQIAAAVQQSQLIMQPQTDPTAAPGVTVVKTEHIYSAVGVQNGSQSIATAFVGAKTNPIPFLGGSSNTGILPLHQNKYTDLTTNFVQSGQGGGTIGDAMIWALGATIEQCPFAPATGAQGAFGAGIQEYADILAKVYVIVKLNNNEQIQGRVGVFPSLGAPVGAVASNGTTTGSIIAVLSNGVPGQGRQFAQPIPVGRYTTLSADVQAAEALAFSSGVTTGTGNSTLIWIDTLATISGDAKS